MSGCVVCSMFSASAPDVVYCVRSIVKAENPWVLHQGCGSHWLQRMMGNLMKETCSSVVPGEVHISAIVKEVIARLQLSVEKKAYKAYMVEENLRRSKILRKSAKDAARDCFGDETRMVTLMHRSPDHKWGFEFEMFDKLIVAKGVIQVRGHYGKVRSCRIIIPCAAVRRKCSALRPWNRSTSGW